MNRPPLGIRKKLWIGLAVLNLIALPAIYFLSRPAPLSGSFPQAESALPSYGPIGPFSLTDQNGLPFSSEKLKNTAWVANFIFTRCPNQCPVMTLKMRSLATLIRDPKFFFLSFSVDPEHDTPEVLAKYIQTQGVEHKRWFFLTGPIKEIHRVMGEAHLGSSDDPSMHSLRFVLVDNKGQVRGYYDFEDKLFFKKITHDLELLSKESAL